MKPEQRPGMYHSEGGVHAYENAEIAPSYIEYVLGRLKLPEHPTILDTGSGSGQEAKVLADLFKAQVVESDLSPSAWQVNPDPNRILVLADMNRQPFRKGVFDLVHSKDNLVHVAQKPEFFKEIYRILKFNGQFLLVTTCVAEPNIPRNYFVVNENGQYSEHTFKDQEDYLSQVDGIKKQSGDRTILEISPPYYPSKSKQIETWADRQGLRLDREFLPIAWQPKREEKNWGQFSRRVLLFRKMP